MAKVEADATAGTQQKKGNRPLEIVGNHQNYIIIFKSFKISKNIQIFFCANNQSGGQKVNRVTKLL